MVNITGRIAKLIVIIVYPIIFGLVELAGKLDQVAKGQITIFDALKQAFLDLLNNGFKNAPKLLETSLQLFESNNPVMGCLRLAQFAMFIILLAVLLSLPAFGLGVIGLSLGFFSLIVWATMNTFLLSMILNEQFPAVFGLNAGLVGFIIVIVANVLFLLTVYFVNRRSTT